MGCCLGAPPFKALRAHISPPATTRLHPDIVVVPLAMVPYKLLHLA